MDFSSTVWNLANRSVARARRHRVSALLHRLKPSGVRPADRQAFAADFRKTLAENLRFEQATLEALGILAEAGIPAIPLKGVFFSQRYYSSLGVRPQSDVDLLVQERDRGRAHHILSRAGWGEAVPREFYATHYHWVYAQGGILLELHWALKFPGTCTPDLTRLWRRAAPGSRAGTDFLELTAEDTLSALGVNKGVQHFALLLDFVDLDRVIRGSSLSWERWLGDVLEDRIAGPLWFGLTGCRELLDTPVPGEVLQALSAPLHAKLSWLLRKVMDSWGGPLHVPSRFLEGPGGRIYEALLEGRPAAIFHLLVPLVLPCQARVDALAQGSYTRYYLTHLKRVLFQTSPPPQ